jgi:hypothetical protein
MAELGATMADDEIQKNIRNALSAIIAGEKQTLHSNTTKVMRNTASALLTETGDGNASGHQRRSERTLRDRDFYLTAWTYGNCIRSKSMTIVFSIGTNYGFSEKANEYFTVEEYQYFDFRGDSSEKTHRLKTEDEVIRLVLEAIGKHIALKQAVDERNQKAKS